LETTFWKKVGPKSTFKKGCAKPLLRTTFKKGCAKPLLRTTFKKGCAKPLLRKAWQNQPEYLITK
jgi:hypothetical protein